MVLKQGLVQLRAERSEVKRMDSEANRLNVQSAEDEIRSRSPLRGAVVHFEEGFFKEIGIDDNMKFVEDLAALFNDPEMPVCGRVKCSCINADSHDRKE